MNIKQLISKFGRLLPNNKRLNNYQFAELIKQNYSLNNPITFKMFNELRSKSELYFKKEFNKIKIIRI